MWVNVWERLRPMRTGQQAPEMTPVQSVWNSWCHADKLSPLGVFVAPSPGLPAYRSVSVRPCQNHHFPQVSHAPPFHWLQTECAEDASRSSPAWSQLCDNPYGNRWQQFGLVMSNGDVLSLHYATVWMLWPFFLTGTLLRDPRDPRLCHFLRKWHLLRTSTRPQESIKTCVGAQTVVSDTLNSKLVTLSSDRGQGRVTDKPYPDFKSKVMPGFRH